VTPSLPGASTVVVMVSRQVVKAQSLCFQEEGVFNVVKMVFLPWYNSYRFLMQNIARLEVCPPPCVSALSCLRWASMA
jgi:hypothetical protein